MMINMSKIILLNKPFNVLCQFSDKNGRQTLADYISDSEVYPAGRLDYDSEGLVVLTNDGQLQHQISHPKNKLKKTYWAQVEGIPTEQQLARLRDGIQLKDGLCRPATVKLIDDVRCWPRTPPIRERRNQPTQWLQITVTEGRNRQVRRMTAAIGFPTLRLIRTNIGRWSIDDLAPGQHRCLQVHAARSKAQYHRHMNTPKRKRTV